MPNWQFLACYRIMCVDPDQTSILAADVRQRGVHIPASFVVPRRNSPELRDPPQVNRQACAYLWDNLRSAAGGGL